MTDELALTNPNVMLHPMPNPMPSSVLSCWLRLSLEAGVGPVAARALLEEFGPPEQIYATDPRVLAARLPAPLARQLAAPTDGAMQARIDEAQAWADLPGNYLLTLADTHYPPALLATHDPPLLLYVKGLPSLLGRHGLAVVGARNATPDGLGNARDFSRHLAGQGWTIVSGLALGIDAAAHEGALAAGPEGGGTIAVIGTGADVVYPARNHALARRIAECGAIVSELPLGTPAIAHHFPRRNRLVAGLSRGVLVVEAAVHSGSLITARLAADIGRDVFAIPGSIHSPLSRGCHALLRQGARLVETSQDIMDELAGVLRGKEAQREQEAQPAQATTALDAAPRRPPTATRLLSGDAARFPGDLSADALSPEDRAVLHAMAFSPIGLDALALRCGLAPHALHGRLLMLELDGHIGRLPGGQYQRQRVRATTADLFAPSAHLSHDASIDAIQVAPAPESRSE